MRNLVNIAVTFVALLFVSFSLTGCFFSEQQQVDETQQKQTHSLVNEQEYIITNQQDIDDEEQASFNIDVEHMDFGYDGDDQPYSIDTNKATWIECEGTSCTIDGDGASATESEICISAGGTYVLNGKFTGQILIDCLLSDKVQLLLNEFSIVNNNAPVIYAKSAEKLVIASPAVANFLKTCDIVSDKNEDEKLDACIYSECDLTFNGSGTNYILSDQNGGIHCKKKISFIRGQISIVCEKDGIVGDDCVKIRNGIVHVHSYDGDGIKTTNECEPTLGFISIEDGSIDFDTEHGLGIYASNYLRIIGGSVYSTKSESSAISSDVDAIISGGSIKTKETHGTGISIARNLVVDNGEFSIESDGDGISSERIIINDGKFDIASGANGFNSFSSDILPKRHVKANDSASIEMIFNNGEANITAGQYCLYSIGSVQINGGIVHALSWHEGLDPVFVKKDVIISDGTLIFPE